MSIIIFKIARARFLWLVAFLIVVAFCQPVEAVTNSLIIDNGNWNTAGSWSLGTVPTGADTVLIPESNTVSVTANPLNAYAGDLMIQSNATLDMGNVQITTCMPSATGKVFLYDGALIQGQRFGYDGNTMTVSNDFILSGDSAFTRSSYNCKVFFTGEWSGTGGVTFNCRTYATRANDTYNFAGSSPNTYTGGTIIQSVSPGGDLDLFYANADGCFGAGDVTVNAGMELRLNGSTTDTVDDTATLFVNGDATINLYGNNETVGGLVIDGCTVPAGSYDSTGRSWLTGSGILTVLAPSDTTDPVFVSISDDVSGGPVSQTNYLVNYTVHFDDMFMDETSVDSSDFTNAGSASVTIGTVSQLSATNFAIPVWIDGAGTIQLGIIQDTEILDMASNALDTTTVLLDDNEITVNAYASPAVGAGAVPTIDAVTNAPTDSGTTLSVTLDASGSDKLVVVVTGEHGFAGSTDGDCTGVTYDGTALTQAIDRSPIGSAPSASVDQTFNDIWYLDNPGAVHTAGAIEATVAARGNLTAFALSGTAPGVGGTAISPQEFKYVRLGTVYTKSVVIASHGMGGEGNSANVASVNTEPPLVETSALENGQIYDGHVTGYMFVEGSSIVVPTFIGGNIVGTHTIAAEFGGGPPLGTMFILR